MGSTLQNTDWMKHVEEAVASLTEHPEFNRPHPFPLNELQKHLRALFDRPHLTLEMQARGWMPTEALFSGIATPRCPLSILFTPLEHPLYFLMSEQDVKFLMSDLLGGEHACAPFYETEQMSGFYRYLGLEVLALCDALHFANDLSPRLEEAPKHLEEHLSKTECFVVDVIAKLGSGSFSSRILIPKTFRTEWKEYFAALPPPP